MADVSSEGDVQFAVERRVRGITTQDAAINNRSIGNCTYSFTVGERYVVYAYRDRQTDTLTASICSRTAPVSNASSDLQYFDELRQELTLTQIDKHSVELEKIDVEGILAFAERVLPRASDLWVQASLNQKQRLQHLFFPHGVVFDGKRFVRTAVTANAFNYLTVAESSQNEVASLMPGSWNQIVPWLRRIEELRRAA